MGFLLGFASQKCNANKCIVVASVCLVEQQYSNVLERFVVKISIAKPCKIRSCMVSKSRKSPYFPSMLLFPRKRLSFFPAKSANYATFRIYSLEFSLGSLRSPRLLNVHLFWEVVGIFVFEVYCFQETSEAPDPQRNMRSVSFGKI